MKLSWLNQDRSLVISVFEVRLRLFSIYSYAVFLKQHQAQKVHCPLLPVSATAVTVWQYCAHGVGHY